MKIAVRKKVLYSSIVTISTVLYVLFVNLAERMLEGLIGYRSIWWTSAVLACVILVSIPLWNRARKILDNYFFKGTIEVLAEERDNLFTEVRRTQQLRQAGLLAAGFAHEISNPLATIQTFINHLNENNNDPEFLETFQRLIPSEIDKIHALTNKMLDFSKSAPLNFNELDLFQLIDDAISFIEDKFIARGICAIKQYHAESQPLVTDKSRLNQVFLNLFLNAADAMPDGGTLTVKTLSRNGSVVVHVIDTGTGINEEDLPKIFNPFYTKKDNGTGLGLTISKAIIEELGASISVTGLPSIGAVFTLTFPVKLSAASLVPQN